MVLHVRRGRYAPQLRRWLAEFPAERLLVMTAESLFRDAAGGLSRTYAHLGLPDRPDVQLGARHTRSYPPMADSIRDQLSEAFADDIAEIDTLLGRPTQWLTSSPHIYWPLTRVRR